MMSLYTYFKSHVKPNLFVLDVETTQEGPEGEPDAYHAANSLIAIGWTNTAGDAMVVSGPESRKYPEILAEGFICGNNIKFDMAWVNRCAGFYKHKLNIGIDIGIATYLHSGQYVKYPTLDRCAEYWGVIERKIPMPSYASKVSDLTKKDLENYLRQDIVVSNKILNKILTTCTDSFLFTCWIYSAGGAIISQMEQNGIPILFDQLVVEAEELAFERDHFLRELNSYTQALLSDWGMLNKEIPTPRTGAFLLHKLSKEDINVVGSNFAKLIVYNKPIKLHTIKDEAKIFGVLYPEVSLSLFLLDEYFKPWTEDSKCDEDVISDHLIFLRAKYASSGLSLPAISHVINWLDTYLKYKKVTKLISTYYHPNVERMRASELLSIHSKYNQTATSTTRLSSSKPNAQNFPPELRRFVWSGHPGNVLITADFKQIEVCALAYSTQDNVLINHIDDGVDVHGVAGKPTFGATMTELERRSVKGVVFGTIYGGSAATLSEQTGLPLEAVRDIQATLMEVYEKAFKKQNDRVRLVKGLMNSSVHSRIDKTTGKQLKRCDIETLAPSVMYYTFEEHVNRKTGETYVSGPEVKDRPIQGLASYWKVLYYTLLHRLLLNSAPTELRDAYLSCRLQFLVDVHDETVVSCPKELAEDMQCFMKAVASDYLPEEVDNLMGGLYQVPKIVLSTSVSDKWSKG